MKNLCRFVHPLVEGFASVRWKHGVRLMEAWFLSDMFSRICNPYVQSNLQFDCKEYKHLQCDKSVSRITNPDTQCGRITNSTEQAELTPGRHGWTQYFNFTTLQHSNNKAFPSLPVQLLGEMMNLLY